MPFHIPFHRTYHNIPCTMTCHGIYHAIPRHAIPYTMSRLVTPHIPYHKLLYHAIPRHSTPYHTPHHATPRHATQHNHNINYYFGKWWYSPLRSYSCTWTSNRSSITSLESESRNGKGAKGLVTRWTIVMSTVIWDEFAPLIAFASELISCHMMINLDTWLSEPNMRCAEMSKAGNCLRPWAHILNVNDALRVNIFRYLWL